MSVSAGIHCHLLQQNVWKQGQIIDGHCHLSEEQMCSMGSIQFLSIIITTGQKYELLSVPIIRLVPLVNVEVVAKK